MRIRPLIAASLLAPAAIAACGDDTNPSATLPSTYAFESKFVPGASSVRYDGQIFRQVLLVELDTFIGSLSASIDNGSLTPTKSGDLIGALDYYLRFDAETSGSDAIRLSTTPGTLQATFDDFDSTAFLAEKIAGNDAVTDHKDFSGTAFRGWSDASIAAQGGNIVRPEGLITAFFTTLEKAAIDRVNGHVSLDGGGKALPVHVTPSGLDLGELVAKFTTCAVAFHQATDDYLDDATPEKGLLSSNAAPAEGVAYTALEHAWDEGFGYFGAARDYRAYTDEELSGKGGRDDWARGYHDTDGDQSIDLFTEYNFSQSTYAAKRDLASVASGRSDFTARIGKAFIRGRAIISAAAGRALSESEMTSLKTARDEAVGAWEEALSATGLHYLNRTIVQLNAAGTEAFDHQKLAGAWSELKGFSLCPQFNPRSPLTGAQFDRLHSLIGDAPVLPSAGAEALAEYKTALLEARGILMDAYGFPAISAGDANGQGGW